jgi:amino acid adenylation domain-containing protein
MVTLLDQFDVHVRTRPGAMAVHDRGVNYSYGELAECSQRLAGWLQSVGVQPGDRIAMVLPNSIEYVVCYLAVLRVGAVIVALNPQTTPEELSYTLRDADPVVAVVHSRAIGMLAEAVNTDPPASLRCVIDLSETPQASSIGGSLMVVSLAAALSGAFRHTGATACQELMQIIYTSGTTGRPKGVMLSHRNVLANCASIVRYLHLSSSDSVLVVLPFFYSYGNSLLFTHLAVGGRLILNADFIFWNAVLDALEQHEVSGFSGVPATYALLLHKSNIHERQFPALRYMTCAGGALSPAHVAELRQAIPNAQLFPMYGQTEATARLSTLLPEDLDRKPGSIGRGIDGVTLRVLNERGERVRPGEIGEIVASGDNVMVGYWRDESATARVLRPEGLRTGDLARIDDDGYITVVGRNNDLIKSGAYRINPQEIEDVLAELAGVAEAAVVGMPDDIWGERPVAFLVPSAVAGDNLEQTAWDHCRERLPRYKQPREVRLVDRLPRTSSGKVKRTALRSLPTSHAAAVAPVA